MLLILVGITDRGKSTISQYVASELNATYIRVDTIEQSLRDAGFLKVHGEGYELAYKIAADNLALGIPVVADSVNSTAITRDTWRSIGRTMGVQVMEIEIICSDQAEHKQRLESRVMDIENLTPPTWNEVLTREYEPWPEAHAVIDTAGEIPEQSFKKTLSLIKSISTEQ